MTSGKSKEDGFRSFDKTFVNMNLKRISKTKGNVQNVVKIIRDTTRARLIGLGLAINIACWNKLTLQART